MDRRNAEQAAKAVEIHISSNLNRILERLPKELNKRFHIADVKGGSPGEVVYMPAYFLMFLEHDGLPENVVYEIEL